MYGVGQKYSQNFETKTDNLVIVSNDIVDVKYILEATVDEQK